MSYRHKILHIIFSWESEVGSELAELITRLPRDEFESEICVLAGSNNQKVLDVPTTTLDLRWPFDPVAYLGIRRILRRFCPDTVHVWDATAQLYGTIHCGPQRVLAEKREFSSLSRYSESYLNRKTYRFIVPRNDHSLPHDKTIIIPPSAVPVPCVVPIPADELLEKLGFPLVEPSGNYYPVFQPQYLPAREITYRYLIGKCRL